MDGIQLLNSCYHLSSSDRVTEGDKEERQEVTASLAAVVLMLTRWTEQNTRFGTCSRSWLIRLSHLLPADVARLKNTFDTCSWLLPADVFNCLPPVLQMSKG